MSDPTPSPVVSDRNLLFAVLALQTDLIDNDQFVEACTAWTARKHKPLAELLIERGWLTTQDRSDIERLLERKLHKHGGDWRASLAAVIDHRAYQSLSRLDDRDIQESLAGLPSPSPLPLTRGEGGVGGEAAIPESGETTPYILQQRERYTLTRLHAKG